MGADEPLLCRAFDGPDERCLSRLSEGSRRALYEDSPLEETGFEPSVPRDTTEVSRGAHVVSA
jgi:hypothetical protein